MRAASLILTVVVLVSASRAQKPASLILNGSFEEGPEVARFLNLAGGDTSLPGWIVTGEGVDYVSTAIGSRPTAGARSTSTAVRGARPRLRTFRAASRRPSQPRPARNIGSRSISREIPTSSRG